MEFVCYNFGPVAHSLYKTSKKDSLILTRNILRMITILLDVDLVAIVVYENLDHFKSFDALTALARVLCRAYKKRQYLIFMNIHLV